MNLIKECFRLNYSLDVPERFFNPNNSGEIFHTVPILGFQDISRDFNPK